MMFSMVMFVFGSSQITFLFVCLQTHKIKKFVLHTNYPGHADFNSYIKCNFVIFASDCKSISDSKFPVGSVTHNSQTDITLINPCSRGFLSGCQ